MGIVCKHNKQQEITWGENYASFSFLHFFCVLLVSLLLLLNLIHQRRSSRRRPRPAALSFTQTLPPLRRTVPQSASFSSRRTYTTAYQPTSTPNLVGLGVQNINFVSEMMVTAKKCCHFLHCRHRRWLAGWLGSLSSSLQGYERH